MSNNMPMIFISHRRTDKTFADLFADFLLRCGIKSDYVFCSSLPGNDVKIDIPGEVKDNIRKSVLNIVLLSEDYYKSPYCMNEEGIIWYLDTPKVVICLPEINGDNMQGFLDRDNKLRRLDSKDDVLAIVDIVRPFFPDFLKSAAKLDSNIGKLIADYKAALAARHAPPQKAEKPVIEQLVKEAVQEFTEITAKNSVDELIAKGFTEHELLFIQYILDTGRMNFMCGWQAQEELQKIRAWESVNSVKRLLSSNYSVVTDRLLARKMIAVSQKTQFGKPKEYALTEHVFKQIKELTQASRQKLATVVGVNRTSLNDEMRF